MKKRIISMLAVALLLFTMLPVTAFATTTVYDGTYATVDTQNNNDGGNRKLRIRVYIDGVQSDSVLKNYNTNPGTTSVTLKSSYTSSYAMALKTATYDTAGGTEFTSGNYISISNNSSVYLNILLTTINSGGGGDDEDSNTPATGPGSSAAEPVTDLADTTNFPGYNEEGSVAIDKDAHWYGDAWGTGVTDHYAQVSLTVNAVPEYSGVDVVMVLDNSYSMVDSFSNLKTAANNFISTQFSDYTQGVSSDNRVAVVNFARYANWAGGGSYPTFYDSASSTYLTNYVTGLQCTFVNAYTATNYEAALTAAANAVNYRTDASRPVVIMFMTDGDPNTGNQDTTYLKSLLPTAATTYTVGFMLSNASSITRLQTLATSPSYFRNVSDVSTLDPVFTSIAHLARKSATEAVIYDTMGAQFDFVPSIGTYPVQVDGVTVDPSVAYWDSANSRLVWNLGDIPEGDITLTYFIKLKDNTATGTYPTNTEATVTYKNYRDYYCEQTFPVPVLPVPGGAIRVLFYEVDSNGNALADNGEQLADNSLSLILTRANIIYDGYVQNPANTENPIVLYPGVTYSKDATTPLTVSGVTYNYASVMRYFDQDYTDTSASNITSTMITSGTWSGDIDNSNNSFYLLCGYERTYNLTVTHQYGSSAAVADNTQSGTKDAGDAVSTSKVDQVGYELDSVTVTPDDGFTANQSTGAVTGTMPASDVAVAYVYDLVNCDYTIEYYYGSGDTLASYAQIGSYTVSDSGDYGTPIYASANMLSAAQLAAAPLNGGYAYKTASADHITLGLNASSNVLKLYYEASQFNYTVNYFKDGSATPFSTVGPYNATYGSTVYDSAYYLDSSNTAITGYKLDSGDTTTQITIGTSGNVINIYYVKDAFNYSVEHYYVGETTPFAVDSTNSGVDNTPLNSGNKVEFGTIITSYTAKTVNGYYVYSDTTPMTITAIDADNVIKVYYAKASYDYTVEYYKDGVKFVVDSTNATLVDNGATLNSGNKVVYLSTVTLDSTDINKYLPTGYKLGSPATEPASASISIDYNEANNVIKVYYVIDQFDYTIEYYKDSDTTAFATTPAASADYGSEIVVTDTIKNAELGNAILAGGYVYSSFTATNPNAADNMVIADNNNNVIKVYYVKNGNLNYTVKYYTNTTDSMTGATYLGAASDYTSPNVTFGDEITLDTATLNLSQPEGYKDGTQQGTVPYEIVAQDNVITVLYVLNSYPYTIEHIYRDLNGDEVTSLTWYEANGTLATYGSAVGYTPTTTGDYAGYTLNTADTVVPNANTEGKMVIGTSGNTITVYYDVIPLTYQVEYYLQATETQIADGASTVTIGTTEYIKSTDTKQFDSYYGATVSVATGTDLGQMDYLNETGYGNGFVNGTNSATLTDGTQVFQVLYDLQADYSYTVEHWYKAVGSVDYTYGSTTTATPPVMLGDIISSATAVTYSLANADYSLSSNDAPLTITSTNANNVITLYYDQNTYSYTVRYYTDSIDSASATTVGSGNLIGYVTNSAVYGASIPTNAVSAPSGYEAIPAITGASTVGTGSNEAFVVFSRSDIGYTIEYYYTDSTGTTNLASETDTFSAFFGSNVDVTTSLIDSYESGIPAGYEFSYADPAVYGRLSISASLANNVIKAYYVRSALGYTVNYYKDSISTGNLIDTVSSTTALLDDAIPVDTAAYVPTGYTGACTIDNSNRAVSATLSENIINVVYTTKGDYGYTIEYYYDNGDGSGDRALGDTVTGLTAQFGSTVDVTDTIKNARLTEAYLGSEASFYAISAVTPSNTLTISATSAENVIKVYYSKTAFAYTVEYYMDYLPDSANYVKADCYLGDASHTESISSTVTAVDQTLYLDTIPGYGFNRVEGLPLDYSYDGNTVIRVLYTMQSGAITLDKVVQGTIPADGEAFTLLVTGTDFSQLVTLTAQDGEFESYNLDVPAWGTYTVTEVNADGNALDSTFAYTVVGESEVYVGGATLQPEVTVTNILKTDGQLIIDKDAIGALYDGRGFNFTLSLWHDINRFATESEINAAAETVATLQDELSGLATDKSDAQTAYDTAKDNYDADEISIAIAAVAQAQDAADTIADAQADVDSAQGIYDVKLAALNALTGSPVSNPGEAPEEPALAEGVTAESDPSAYAEWETDHAAWVIDYAAWDLENTAYQGYQDDISNATDDVSDAHDDLTDAQAALSNAQTTYGALAAELTARQDALAALQADTDKAAAHDALAGALTTAQSALAQATNDYNSKQAQLTAAESAAAALGTVEDPNLIPDKEPVDIADYENLSMDKDANGEYAFVLADGDMITINDLPVDTQYTVSEETGSVYTSSVNGALGSSLTSTISENDQASFVNDFGSGSVTVTKVYSLSDEQDFGTEDVHIVLMKIAESANSNPYLVEAADDSESVDIQVGECTIGNGGSYTFENLGSGSYYAVETTVPGGYTVSYSSDYVYISQQNHNDEITVTNTSTYVAPARSITVEKIYPAEIYSGDVTIELYQYVDGENDLLIGSADFASNESYTFTSLTRGTYYAVETSVPSGYSVSYSGEIQLSDTVTSGTITVSNYKGSPIVITNERKITITKEYVGTAYDDDVTIALFRKGANADTQVATVRLGDGESQTVTVALNGTYYAIETTVPDNYEVSYSSDVDIASYTDTGVITVTNTELEVTLPDDGTPLAPTPDDPTVPEEPTVPDEPTEVIPEDDVPLADLPKTGEMQAIGFAAAGLASLLGGVTLKVKSRKEHKDEDK